MVIDIHNHFLPDNVIEYIRKYGCRINTEIIKKNGREFIWDKQAGIFPIYEAYYDYDKKIADLNSLGIDMAVLSVIPNVYYYWAHAEAAFEIAAMCNDWVANLSRNYPKRFRGMATVPMQCPQMALRELRRAHEILGLNCLATAPMILDSHLDSNRFFPIYEYCVSHNMIIFLHPCFAKPRAELKKYYNINLVGNVYQTSLGIDHLILGGVFERFPDLKVITSHGGGYFPYQMGRIEHGYMVRQETRKKISRQPKSYIENLYFDSITHWNAALQFLVDQFGSDHVLLGTDYPFDMGDYQAIQRVRALNLETSERVCIYSENAIRLLCI